MLLIKNQVIGKVSMGVKWLRVEPPTAKSWKPHFFYGAEDVRMEKVLNKFFIK